MEESAHSRGESAAAPPPVQLSPLGPLSRSRDRASVLTSDDGKKKNAAVGGEPVETRPYSPFYLHGEATLTGSCLCCENVFSSASGWVEVVEVVGFICSGRTGLVPVNQSVHRRIEKEKLSAHSD